MIHKIQTQRNDSQTLNSQKLITKWRLIRIIHKIYIHRYDSQNSDSQQRFKKMIDKIQT